MQQLEQYGAPQQYVDAQSEVGDGLKQLANQAEDISEEAPQWDVATAVNYATKWVLRHSCFMAFAAGNLGCFTLLPLLVTTPPLRPCD